ncbi:hypothetical protein OG985_48195 [Streptomyces sp. NBC_00289]|uniref:hypothetical protein n=1 Tax=Streptomyces sp. NBC_00289 TaxID=2975703 RepID=UPI00324D1F35
MGDQREDQSYGSFSDLVDEIGGLPFLDDSFRPSTLLTLVATMRRNLDPTGHASLVDYLDPGNATAIYRKMTDGQGNDYDYHWVPLTGDQERRVSSALTGVAGAVASWAPLFAIPLRYRKIQKLGVRSATDLLIPQTIYLGEGAFSSPHPLEEILVHEQAHVWLHFIAEICDLQKGDAPEDFVLPSGTSDRTLRGVLVAAHFAASAIKFYACAGAGMPDGETRVRYLIDYFSGCLDLAAGHPSLTPMGQVVLDRLTVHREALWERCQLGVRVAGRGRAGGY